MTKAADLVCTCMRFDSLELLGKWHRRARGITKRMLAHGHPMNPAGIQETQRLLHQVALGTPEATEAQHWARSHHLVKCPCHGRRNPLATVEF